MIVADEELVETQEPAIGRDRLGHRRDRIVAFHLAPFQLLAEGEDPRMHVGDEAVEMQPPLMRELGLFEKQVHSMVLPRPTEPQM